MEWVVVSSKFQVLLVPNWRAFQITMIYVTPSISFHCFTQNPTHGVARNAHLAVNCGVKSGQFAG